MQIAFASRREETLITQNTKHRRACTVCTLSLREAEERAGGQNTDAFLIMQRDKDEFKTTTFQENFHLNETLTCSRILELHSDEFSFLWVNKNVK